MGMCAISHNGNTREKSGRFYKVIIYCIYCHLFLLYNLKFFEYSFCKRKWTRIWSQSWQCPQGLAKVRLERDQMALGVFPNCHESQKIDFPVLKKTFGYLLVDRKPLGFWKFQGHQAEERLHYAMFVILTYKTSYNFIETNYFAD